MNRIDFLKTLALTPLLGFTKSDFDVAGYIKRNPTCKAVYASNKSQTLICQFSCVDIPEITQKQSGKIFSEQRVLLCKEESIVEYSNKYINLRMPDTI